MKQIKDMYVNGKWLTLTSITLIGDWTTLTNTVALDSRIYDCFSEKYLCKLYQGLTDTEINKRVADYINSLVYELDGLYKSTQLTYNPIENYNMTEGGSDTVYSNAGGSTTNSSTSYDSTTQKETDKSVTAGSSSDTTYHDFQRSGNIGVTSSQDLIKAQRDVVEFDFIGYVAEKVIEHCTIASYYPFEDEREVIL